MNQSCKHFRPAYRAEDHSEAHQRQRNQSWTLPIGSMPNQAGFTTESTGPRPRREGFPSRLKPARSVLSAPRTARLSGCQLNLSITTRSSPSSCEGHVRCKKSGWAALRGAWVPHDTQSEIVNYVNRWTKLAELPARRILLARLGHEQVPQLEVPVRRSTSADPARLVAAGLGEKGDCWLPRPASSRRVPALDVYDA
jgi:hypothetical protein